MMKKETDNTNEQAHGYEEPACPVTNRKDMIDDCYIEIQFGYGSDKDMMTYKFGPVHDIVGKKVLEAIQSLMIDGKSVEDFGRDTIAEEFDENWWEKLSKEEQTKYKKEWGIT
jgi:hypothetical protein